MLRRVVIPGLLGGLVMIVWAFVVNGLFGFNASVNMKQIPNERQVYELLKENITEPGRFVCNPALTESNTFPEGEPVFSVLNGGVGHEAAGGLALIGLLLFFVIPILAVWMLSRANDAVLASYPKKLLFFTAVGLLIGLTNHLTDFGIAGYPLRDAIALSIHDLILWTCAGLVMARWVKPQTA